MSVRVDKKGEIYRLIGIYMIRCKPNGKVYVGQSTNIEKRWKNHKWNLNGNYHHCKELQKDWNIYGEDNFEFKVVQKCKEENLDELEIIHIEQFEAFEKGYNYTKGGSGSLGKVFSEETRKKMSESLKGRESPWAGKHLSNEQKEKLRIYRTGTSQTEETKKKISNATKGGNNPNCKKLICVYSNGDKTEVMYQKELADYLNISEGLLKSILKGGIPFKPNHKKHKHLEGIKIIKVEESDINGK